MDEGCFVRRIGVKGQLRVVEVVVLVMCRRLSRVNARVAESCPLEVGRTFGAWSGREVCKLFLLL
jgi:hypothetical protein